jgi:tripartite-type tricarboxylate transporter receptor subunit TctC
MGGLAVNVAVSAICSTVIAALTLGSLTAFAQDYPTHPITVIVPYPPGASTDFVARMLKEPMSAALGQPLVIENRPGAGGTNGAAAVARAAPDGYTLLVTVNAPITMNKYFQKDYPVDPNTAFAAVTNAANVVLVLAVNSSVPVKTVPELIDYAKKNPGKLSFGSAGIGSAHHIAGELLNQKAGIHIQHVPYRGGGPAIQDLIAGHVPIAFGTTPAVLPQAKAGAIRIIALAEAKRDPDMPDVPTIAETVPGVVTATWVGMFAPAGTPRAIIDKLNKAAVDALKQPDVIARLKVQGANAVGSSPAELDQLVKTEYAHWGKIMPSIGIQPE